MVRYSCEKHFRGNTRDSQDALAADILALIRPVVDELAQYRKLPVEAICRCPLPHGPMTKSILDHIKESAEALG